MQGERGICGNASTVGDRYLISRQYDGERRSGSGDHGDGSPSNVGNRDSRLEEARLFLTAEPDQLVLLVGLVLRPFHVNASGSAHFGAAGHLHANREL